MTKPKAYMSVTGEAEIVIYVPDGSIKYFDNIFAAMRCADQLEQQGITVIGPDGSPLVPTTGIMGAIHKWLDKTLADLRKWKFKG